MIYSFSEQEDMLTSATSRRRIALGCPDGSRQDARFPLTPEAVASIVRAGVDVMIQSGAGATIHYPDEAYAAAGATLTDRTACISTADVVLSLPELTMAEVRSMRRGSVLLTLSGSLYGSLPMSRELIRSGVASLALDLLTMGTARPFAEAMHQIDGCAAIAVAAAMLADKVDGKGILLGGVTGIAPCEVMVVGSGFGAIAAARRACGAGALVRMFDDDLAALCRAENALPAGAVVTSAMHPHVVEGALRSADVVVVTPTDRPLQLPDGADQLLKAHALVFDITGATPSAAFPSLEVVDLSGERRQPKGRACFVNVGFQVPRTVAMAMSNVLMRLVPSISDPDAWATAHPEALMTLFGKPVNAALARLLHMRCIDPNLLTSLS
jgi:alanine dehydrogenase